MQLELMETDLGRCLVTTPEQTLLDLAHRPEQDTLPDDVDTALKALAPRCDAEVLAEIAGRQRLGRALDRLRRTGLAARPLETT